MPSRTRWRTRWSGRLRPGWWWRLWEESASASCTPSSARRSTQARSRYIVRPGTALDAIAHHLRQAGEPRAGEWLVREGNRAVGTYAWWTAAVRFEAALEYADEPRERGWLLYRTS